MRNLGEAATVAEIRRRMATLTSEDTGLWGTMSVEAMVCHLRESFRMALGEMVATPVKMLIPGGVVRWIALWTPLAWAKNLPTVPELRRGTVGAPSGFAVDYAGLVAAFERFRENRENRTDHPMFGAMRPKDWMRWGYLHTDHHLRQFGR